MEIFSLSKENKNSFYQWTLLVLILSLSFILQVWLASFPDKAGDIGIYQSWAERIAKVGINESYFQEFKMPIDYPPIIPYMLGGIAKAYKNFTFSFLGEWGRHLQFFIKLPGVFANIVISLLIFLLVKNKTSFKVGCLVMLTYALNPAIIFDTACWGQPDAIHSMFLLLSITCLVYKKAELSWIFFTLGVFTKAQVWPFIPLMLFLTYRNYGGRRLSRCILISLATSLVIFSPFIYHNTLKDIVMRMATDIHLMPFISVNAHNIWWLGGLGLSWVPASGRAFGLITYKAIGIILFGCFYCFILFRSRKAKNLELIYLFSASIAFGFFMLLTYLHENHMFAFFPLLAVVYFRDRRLGWLYAFLSITFLANMILHDPFIVSEYIYKISFSSINFDTFTYCPGGSISLFHQVMTLFNSLANTVLFTYFVIYLFSRKYERAFATKE